MAGSFLQPQTSPLSMNRTLSTNSSSNRSSRGLTVGDEFEAPAEINSGAQEPKIEEDARKSDASIKTQEEDVLKGDDFLFIFIDVIVRSDLEAPILTQVLLNRLCDPEKRRSESGYYLATFEAALHHILSLELPGARTKPS
ncbi:hypothetical protein PPTG_04947 [Phytophthora nicotianae INRA-310]|uniref:VPS9 domain-containing protein n=1 Tax=Phytophthora nicotianae (strain INRA-310) TaxID=761204 RepID=W2R2W0_PHYN3|nr:hypothetical protein PPTG_04947 [Phytophthora nicotianae INRA-310]ETN19718.1 hypothetical protein PPTG_04947 [Phytophthora nicotianae INRA-310]